MSEDPSPPDPPRAPSRGVGEAILGIFAGLAISGVVSLVCGVMIAASPPVGGTISVLSLASLVVFQIRGWKRASAFRRGLLLGQIFVALIAGTCFVMLMNLNFR